MQNQWLMTRAKRDESSLEVVRLNYRPVYAYALLSIEKIAKRASPLFVNKSRIRTCSAEFRASAMRHAPRGLHVRSSLHLTWSLDLPTWACLQRLHPFKPIRFWPQDFWLTPTSMHHEAVTLHQQVPSAPSHTPRSRCHTNLAYAPDTYEKECTTLVNKSKRTGRGRDPIPQFTCWI